MSYILDALRKADAQRERNRTPGLHAHPLPAEPADARRELLRSPLLWGLAGAGLLSVAAVAWTLRQPAAPAMPADGLPAAVPRTPGPVPAPAPQIAAAARPDPGPASAIEPAPPPPAPPPRPDPRNTDAGTPPAPAPTARRSTPASTAAAAAPAAPETAATTGPAASAPLPSRPVAAAPVSASTIEGAAPAGAPQLAITGGVYSQSALQRMLIVNGQVVAEGAEAAPGLRIEQIRPQQAVLSWQGRRWAVRY